ncbi:MAG: hypothetical protein J7K81_00840 [Methanophagales archaeon]|nr:hypothetical protein [Methanophagales archaeon]
MIGWSYRRKAFRNAFYGVLARIVREENADCLVQGTIAADVAETVKGIKTQHNILEQIGIDPGSYGLTIVEPLREIYKHEVREVARSLGVPPGVFGTSTVPRSRTCYEGTW